MKKLCIITVFIIVLSLFPISALAFTQEFDYLIDETGTRIPIPLTYTVGENFGYFGGGVGSLNAPEDLFIDKEQNLYIADTGNNRILKTTLEGKLLKVFTGPDKPFAGPKGIFVDEDGDLYVADTNNQRIVHMDPEGGLVEVFTQPDSIFYDKSYPFKPSKLAVDSIGQIYTLNNDDYHGFVVLEPDNSFKGYVAPTKLQFNIMDRITRLLASKEQRERMDKALPPAHSNFVIDEYGTIYTTTIRTKFAQIKRFTPVGRNIYPFKGFFGELSTDYMMQFVGKPFSEPQFTDITVNSIGIISALDGVSGRIYQYDRQGNLLTVFGGTGNWKGKFMNAVSIVEDAEGKIYVLDARLSAVQVFYPTSFLKNIHAALNLYYEGRYSEAEHPWNEILRVDKNYRMAHIGLGKAYLKQDKYVEAMAAYNIANDRDGYSKVFVEYRHKQFRMYFVWIILGIFISISVIYALVKYVFKLKETAWGVSSTGQRVNGFLNSVAILTEPSGGFIMIKRNRKLGGQDFITPIVLLLLIISSRIGVIYITHYPLNPLLPSQANFLLEVGTFLIPLFTLACCAYLVTAIIKGESTFEEQLCSAAYSMLPYIVLSIPIALVSNIMGLGDTVIYDTMLKVMWIWVMVLALFNISVMNSYSFKDTIKVAFLTLFAAAFIWTLIGLFYILGAQLLHFLRQVYQEVYINYLS